MKTGLLSLITSLHLNRLCTFLITQSRAASLSSAAGLYFISLRLALPPCLPSFHLSHLFLFVVVVVILAVVSRRARLHISLFSCGSALQGKEGGPEPEHAEKRNRFQRSWSTSSNKKCQVEFVHERHFTFFVAKADIWLVFLKKKNLHVQHFVVEPRPFTKLWKYNRTAQQVFTYLV